MRIADVIIVGGGPAGSTVATLLADAGLAVRVLERAAFPRFHIGESMLPQSMKVWKRLGVDEALGKRFLPKYGARFLCSTTGRERTYLFEDAFDASVPHAYQVLRSEFDQLLLERAQECGAEVFSGWESLGPLFERDGRGERCVVGVRARDVNDKSGKVHELRAPMVVDASGRDAQFGGALAHKSKIPLLDRTAFFAHYDGVARQSGKNEGNIDIIVFPVQGSGDREPDAASSSSHAASPRDRAPAGWFWNIPFRNGVNSFGFVCNAAWVRTRAGGESLDAFFDRTVAGASWAAELLAGARRIGGVRALADYSYRVSAYAGPGWASVGDATGFVDPLFSTGAHLAFTSGGLAADTIVQALGAAGGASLNEGNGAGGVTHGRTLWRAYETEVRSASELFAGVVQAFYGSDLAGALFADPQRTILRRTITSMLAGDVMGPDSSWRRFLRARYPVALDGNGGSRAAHAGGAPRDAAGATASPVSPVSPAAPPPLATGTLSS